MENLIWWIVWLIALLIVAYVTSKNLLSPQSGFIAGFLVQAVYALPYVDMWDLNFDVLTMQALFSGTGIFLLVSIVVQSIRVKFNYNYKKSSFAVKLSKDITDREKDYQIFISEWKLVVFIVFQLIIIIWEISYMSGMDGNGLAEKIYTYRFLTLRTDIDMNFPLLLKLSVTFCIASVSIWSFLIVHSWICKYKQSKLLLYVNAFLGLVCGLLLGGRGEVITCLVVFSVQAFLIYGKIYGWKRIITPKIIIICLIVFTGALLFFSYSIRLLGRESSENIGYYMAVYLSAELKNLDIFVRRGSFGASITDCYIGADVASLLGKLFSEPSWIHSFYNPFRIVHGHQLGNVGTMFYATLHDGGVAGTWIYISIMAIICQLLYKKVKRTNIDNKINLSIVTYSYVYFMILFSFFSCKFYEMFLCLHMLEIFASWLIVIFFLDKVTLKKGKLKSLKNIDIW